MKALGKLDAARRGGPVHVPLSKKAVVSDGFDGRLAALEQRFRLRTAEQRLDLERIVADLAGLVPRAQLETGIRRIAHSLAGAAGTFGFPGISVCAAELEELLLKRPSSPQLAVACQVLIAEIERAI